VSIAATNSSICASVCSGDGVKIFPVSTHLLSKLRGPLAVEGGPAGADRSTLEAAAIRKLQFVLNKQGAKS